MANIPVRVAEYEARKEAAKKRLPALQAKLLKAIGERIAEQYHETNSLEINRLLVDLHFKLNLDNDKTPYVSKVLKADHVHNLDQIRQYVSMVRGGLKLIVKCRFTDKGFLGPRRRKNHFPCRVDPYDEKLTTFWIITKGDRVTDDKGEKIYLPLSDEICERFRTLRDHHKRRVNNTMDMYSPMFTGSRFLRQAT